MSSRETLLALTPLELAIADHIRHLRRLSRRLSDQGAAYVILPPLSFFQRPAEGLSFSASADETPPQRRPLFPPPVRAMKWRGEVAQIKFASAAMDQNLPAALLLTDSLPIDSVVFGRKRLYSVQIKTTTVEQCAGWLVALHRSPGRDGKSRHYGRHDFDVLAVLIPGDIWYLFPSSVVAGRSALVLPRRPQRHPRKFQIPNIEQYREAWHIFE